MITKKLIDQIEGEATLYFELEETNVVYTTIAFGEFRGIENILESKPALDALMITPRVCGICGHSHLLATVRALEDCYTQSGIEIVLNNKIKQIRELTLIMEMIQNHLKWLYFTIIPSLRELSVYSGENSQLKGAYGASISAKIIALFAGQWPHSSYMIPGGITSDFTNIELLQAKNYLKELVSFVEKECFGVTLEQFLAFESCKDFKQVHSDIAYVESALIKLNMQHKGFAYDRFLVLGEHSFSEKSKVHQTRISNADLNAITTKESFTPHQKSYAKNALYQDKYYETGSLARGIAANKAMIKNIHRRFKDSAYSRVMARVFEIAYLLEQAEVLVESIDVCEASFISQMDIKNISAKGIGVVEAPRGPLLHEIEIEKGNIKNYNIITPTQFNIGSDTKENLTPAQKAMIGVSKAEAAFIFKTFDVCSVCTTH